MTQNQPTGHPAGVPTHSLDPEWHAAYEQASADDLDLLLGTLPPHIRAPLQQLESEGDLLEVVLDLGRRPEARLSGGDSTPGQGHGRYREAALSDEEVTAQDLDYVVSRIGAFGGDNRAGIPRTLHRISAIRNRRGEVVGLTCRVGRSVAGTVEILRDLVEGGRSVLILGRPGVGKTTLLREVGRVLADEVAKRVIIVDTSNEIAGDGDIPHPGIGRARRMQVPAPERQHGVMIEAVENHMPEVIVIDEIGTELEAAAARTIAERGVQLVGTAHGNTLENLLMNPTLSDLVGGIQPVTLGDEEARRRGTQKTVLERKGPPTFDVLVEMRARQQVAVHRDVAETVDALLRGAPAAVEVRTRTDDGTVERKLEVPGAPGVTGRLGDGRDGRDGRDSRDGRGGRGRGRDGDVSERGGRRGRSTWGERGLIHLDRGELEHDLPPASIAPGHGWQNGGSAAALAVGPSAIPMHPGQPEEDQDEPLDLDGASSGDGSAYQDVFGGFRRRLGQSLRPMKLYPFGVNRDRLEAAISAMRLPVTITKDVREADVVMTLKNYYRKSPGPVRDAEDGGKPVFILRSNTTGQIQQSLEALYGMETADPPRDLETLVIRETEDAISRVMQTSRPTELPPQNAYIRRLQHQLAERANVGSRSTGREPHRRVRLFKAGTERPG